jgi:hypothetical protein
LCEGGRRQQLGGRKRGKFATADTGHHRSP